MGTRPPRPRWLADFYPKGLPLRLQLAYAAERMTSIEVNGSFDSRPHPRPERRRGGLALGHDARVHFDNDAQGHAP